MISAFEARDLVKNSDSHLDMLLEKLDAPIRQAAERGESKIDVSMDHVGVGVTTLTHPRWSRLKEKLISLGYRLSVQTRESRPGLGMLDSDNIQKYDVVVLSW